MNHKIVIWDTEFTAWEGSHERGWSEPWEHREIIQIAAVKIDTHNWEEREHLDLLVTPKLNPDLSDYIQELTGISQQDINDKSIDLKNALTQFHIFCNQGKLPAYSYGGDEEVIVESCGLQKIDNPLNMDNVHNIRTTFEKAGIDTSQYTSGTVYQALNLPLTNNAHYALHDVRSIAATLEALKISF